MKKHLPSNKKIIFPFLILTSFLFIGSSAVYGQAVPKVQMDSSSQMKDTAGTKMMQNEEKIPHSFFTHMGMPEPAGIYSLRLSALATTTEGVTKPDFAFHFETGLSDFVGFHIRNDRFRSNPYTEVMFQFAAVRSKDGMSGFSPLIEFEVPTGKGATRINTLVGFSTAFVRSKFAFNQVLHYNPRIDMLDGSAALVFMAGKRFFLIAESLITKMQNENIIATLIGGIKYRINENIILGLGYQWPISRNKDFSSQYIFQPDLEFRRK